MVYYQLSNAFGVLEFDPPEPSDDNVFGVYLPALELKFERSPDGKVLATWRTEDGYVLNRPEVGLA